MSKRSDYIAAGLPLCPGGEINEYQWHKFLGGGIYSSKDPTWVKEGITEKGRYAGHHSCCGSKRSYRHKVGCEFAAKLTNDDLSDLKDI